MEIEKGIPHPSLHKKYPFKRMEVGDSVFVAGQTTTGPAFSAARKYAYDQRAKGFPRRYSAKTANGGVRIWRVE